MNNSSNDVKPAKALNYARAAQGSSTSTPTAGSPQLNGKPAQVSSETDVNSNGLVPEDEKPADISKGSQNAPPTHSSRSSISSAAGSQPAWANKGPGVHMPPRVNSNTSNNNPSTPVQFGNFANPANTPAQKSPTMTKATPVASGGTAPPSAIQGKDVPQFGSIPSNNNALVDNVSSFLDILLLMTNKSACSCTFQDEFQCIRLPSNHNVSESAIVSCWLSNRRQSTSFLSTRPICSSNAQHERPWRLWTISSSWRCPKCTRSEKRYVEPHQQSTATASGHVIAHGLTSHVQLWHATSNVWLWRRISSTAWF